MAESSIHQPHDKLFKLALEEKVLAKEFFTAHLPDHILMKINLSTLKFENHSFIDSDYKEIEADVLYSVLSDSSRAYLYLLVEQQSSIDHLIAFRLLKYTVRIMERHLKQHSSKQLPMVWPMVIYAGDDPWNAPVEIFPLFGELESLARETLFKPYQFLDINRIADEELREQLLSGLVAYTLKHRKMADFKEFLQKLMPWVNEVEIQGRTGASLTRIVLKYIINRVPQGDKNLLVQEAQRYLSSELRGEIMTIAQQWQAEGVQKGIEQGIEQGIQKGEAAMLISLLRHRFGEVPKSVAQKISKANAQTLLLWGEKVLDAANLREIFIEDTVKL